MTIPAYRLPPNIETGARGGPQFSTVIQTAVSGREQRIRKWANSRAKFDIAYGMRESSDPLGDYRAVLSLFYGHYGPLRPFPFKDWSDYQATDANFGTGDGSTTQFQLGKLYDPSQVLINTPGTLTYLRPIYVVVGTPTIKVNTITQTVTTHYTISDSGLVTFVTAPPNGHALAWTGEFDLLVRFDADYMAVLMKEEDVMEIDSITIIEVLGEA